MITLVLPSPPTLNAYYQPVRMGGHLAILPTAKGKAYKQEVAWIARAACSKPLEGKVKLTFFLYGKKGKASMDIDNCLKPAVDGMKNIVFGDDSLIWHIEGHKMPPDEKGARLEVRVEEMV